VNPYVIIGNGVAAVGCIEGIRSVDRQTPITVISEELYAVYGRPLISYYLEGRTTLEKMAYRPADFYERNGCRVLYGCKAQKINADEKTVITDGGSEQYSSVCVATGSSPFIPRFEGLETVENKYSFMTLDDTLALEKALTEDSRVLIVGAGLIGLKCAEGIKDRVGKITVCDLADRVLSSILDSVCAAEIQKVLEANGIDFMLGDTAVKFDKNTALMKSGKTVEFDILVLAVGVRANTSIAAECGAECNRGILVDNRMNTNIDGVYSAGDCTEGFEAVTGQRRVLAILPNAYMQGYTAGVNMAGGSKTLDDAIPVNSIGFFGYHVMTAGYQTEGSETVEVTDGRKLKRFFVLNDTLTGFMLLDANERAGVYSALVRNKTPLSTIDFEKLVKSPSFTSYPDEFRAEHFGGVI